MDFFQHQVVLTAQVPRIECPMRGVRLTNMPWVHPSSGFTLLIKVMAQLMGHKVPMTGVKEVINQTFRGSRLATSARNAESLSVGH